MSIEPSSPASRTPIKALLAFGFNPPVGHADPLVGKRALEALDLYVHVDLFENPTASFADVLLPAASCWESQAVRLFPPLFVLNETTVSWAQYQRAVVPPVHEARPDLEIMFDLARRLGLGEHFFGGDIEAAFDYQLAPPGLTVEQMREHPAGIRVPAETRYQKYREINAQTGKPHGFQTSTGKIEIFATSFARAGYPPVPVWQPAESILRGQANEEDYPLTLTFSRLTQFVNDAHRNVPPLATPGS